MFPCIKSFCNNFCFTASPSPSDFIVLSSDDDDDDSVESSANHRKRAKIVRSGVRRKRPRGTADLSQFNPLDQTAVHPDSYQVATDLIASLGYKLSDVGTPELREAAKNLLKSSDRDARLKSFCTGDFGLDTMRDIAEALSLPVDFDERKDSFLPLFHSSAMSLSDLKAGMSVTGRIENVTTFGAFCDIGVQQNAYIPRHEYPATTASDGMFSLRLGDRISAMVSFLCVDQARITLSDVSLLPPVSKI